MASLSTLLLNKKANYEFPNETNLESGVVYSFGKEVANAGQDWCSASAVGVCWQAPAAGVATIEIWGSGGSSSLMCCCGGSLPGNSGAYSKKVIEVDATSFVCGVIGVSCGNADTCNFRGCSSPTCICYIAADSSNGIMCAEGGAAGYSCCDPQSTGWFCCWAVGGFCNTSCGTECGAICNYTGDGVGVVDTIAAAYGGDVNCPGRVSIASFMGLRASCIASHRYTVPIPYGFFSEEGGEATYSMASIGSGYGTIGSGYPGAAQGSIGLLGNPQFHSTLNAHFACWSGSGCWCDCYQAEGCYLYSPVGTGGAPTHVCGGLRAHGYRGGNGAMRIKFVAS